MKAKLGKDCLVEPTIPTPAGRRIPDLLSKHGDTAWVIDVQVTSDAGIGSMSDAFDRKCLYYSREKAAITDFVKQIWDVSEIKFGAVIASWRGAVCKRSTDLLRNLGLGTNTVELIAVKAVEGSAEIAKTWSRRTTRRRLR
jgi:hypothetical protein